MVQATTTNAYRSEEATEELDKVYVFLLEVLHQAVNREDTSHHLGAREVVEAVRDLAIDRYGPLARTVLGFWGIRSSEDIGRLVFQMIDRGILLRSDQDHPGQFTDLLDFERAFDAEYPWSVAYDEVVL